LYYYTRGRPEDESVTAGGDGDAQHGTLWQDPPGKCARPPQ
jgi:hypothetical protein